MAKKTFKLEVDVEIVKEKKGSIPVRMDVKGMMHLIRRSMSTKNQQDMLDEYAKFYILDQLGVKQYPISK